VSDAGITRMIGLPYGEKNCDNMYDKTFSSDTRALRTDRRTELQYQYRASVCRRAIKKTRIMGLPDGGKTLRICINVYTEYWCATDRRTDRQTDGHLATAYSALCIRVAL